MKPSRPRGRPPLQPGEVSTAVTVRMAPRDYDAVYSQASRDRISVPETIQRAVKKALVEGEAE